MARLKPAGRLAKEPSGWAGAHPPRSRNGCESRPPALLEALVQGPTWILARAEPGLGRLTEAIAFAQVLARSGAGRPALVYTSPAALPLAERWLHQRVRPLTLGAGRDPQQTLIDSTSVQQLLLAVRRGRPSALVVDGYPLLLPLLRSVASAKVVAMANLHDLRSPAHSPGARLLQETLHANSDLIVVSELRRSWRRGRLGKVPMLRIPSLIREDVAGRRPGPGGAGRGVVAVLGGGSRGDQRLEASNAAILQALEVAVERGDLPSCLVFTGGDDQLMGRFPRLGFAGDPAECLPTLAGAELVITRAGRSTLAEVLAAGRRAVAVIPESDTLRGAEQAANAANAARVSPAVVPLPLAELDRLPGACAAALAATPARWHPGNRVLLRALSTI